MYVHVLVQVHVVYKKLIVHADKVQVRSTFINIIYVTKMKGLYQVETNVVYKKPIIHTDKVQVRSTFI